VGNQKKSTIAKSNMTLGRRQRKDGEAIVVRCHMSSGAGGVDNPVTASCISQNELKVPLHL
jgi:hypothetical protein